MKEETSAQNLERWRRIVERVGAEIKRLDERERRWAEERLAEIAALQLRLQGRFIDAGGSEECRRCHGQCCDCGRNHFTLVNLLGFLLQGQMPPEPDFQRPCPFLGESGCRIEVARRPYNCVTFVCEQVEDRMSRSDREGFYVDEARLRLLHEQFDRRYALSSPRGLLIRAARIGDEPLLAAPAQREFKASASAARRSPGVDL